MKQPYLKAPRLPPVSFVEALAALQLGFEIRGKLASGFIIFRILYNAPIDAQFCKGLALLSSFPTTGKSRRNSQTLEAVVSVSPGLFLPTLEDFEDDRKIYCVLIVGLVHLYGNVATTPAQ